MESNNTIQLSDMSEIGEDWAALVARLQDRVWGPDTLVQIGVIAAACVIAALTFRLLRPRMQEAIVGSAMPVRIKRTAANLQQLVFPLILLAVLFVGTQVMSAAFPGAGVFIKNLSL